MTNPLLSKEHMKTWTYNYTYLRKEIDKAKFKSLDNDSLLARDIKRDMYSQLDKIETLHKQKNEIEDRIRDHRNKLKDLAEKWGI